MGKPCVIAFAILMLIRGMPSAAEVTAAIQNEGCTIGRQSGLGHSQRATGSAGPDSPGCPIEPPGRIWPPPPQGLVSGEH
jgi:hypothetical protein